MGTFKGSSGAYYKNIYDPTIVSAPCKFCHKIIDCENEEYKEVNYGGESPKPGQSLIRTKYICKRCIRDLKLESILKN